MDEGWTSWNSWKNWKIPWKMMGLPWKNIVDLRIGLNIDRQNWDVEGHMDSVRSAEEGKERNAIAEFTHFSAGFNKDDGYIIEAGFFWCRNSRHVFFCG